MLHLPDNLGFSKRHWEKTLLENCTRLWEALLRQHFHSTTRTRKTGVAHIGTVNAAAALDPHFWDQRPIPLFYIARISGVLGTCCLLAVLPLALCLSLDQSQTSNTLCTPFVASGLELALELGPVTLSPIGRSDQVTRTYSGSQ